MEDIFITKIEIKKVRHLENFEINLSENERKHLILTGRNGSGKTSVLEELRNFLSGFENSEILQIPGWEKALKQHREEVAAIERNIQETNNSTYLQQLRESKFQHEQTIMSFQDALNRYSKIKVFINPSHTELVQQYKDKNFTLAYFEARRLKDIQPVEGPKKVDFVNISLSKNELSRKFLQHIVNLQNDKASAYLEGESELVQKIDSWFDRFESSLKNIFQDDTLKLKYDRKNYNFEIVSSHREPFDLKSLSDGYSAILEIITELIMRMEACGKSAYDMQGIVLIDEIETHLHLELQKKILPFLTNFFPKIQFIVTTHSPFVLNSVSNAVIYDLENKIHIDDASDLSYSGLVEGYFEIKSEYSSEIEEKMKKYEELIARTPVHEEEKVVLAQLDSDLSYELSPKFSPEMFNRFHEAKRKRKVA